MISKIAIGDMGYITVDPTIKLSNDIKDIKSDISNIQRKMRKPRRYTTMSRCNNWRKVKR